MTDASRFPRYGARSSFGPLLPEAVPGKAIAQPIRRRKAGAGAAAADTAHLRDLR